MDEQQTGSSLQTQSSQIWSSHIPSSRSKQQSLTHGQLAAQSSPFEAMSTQVGSQVLLQQAGSIAQTHASQTESSHWAPACGEQQSPPGVGVAVGVGVASTSQGQLSAQSSGLAAMSAHVPSQMSSQHAESMPHTHDSHVELSHPASSRPKQQSLSVPQLQRLPHSFAASAAHCSSHVSVQQLGSRAQTQSWHNSSSHPRISWGEQQSAMSQKQLGEHSTLATLTQRSSHSVVQQKESRSQTQS
jgi:hypothetical protein